ncbi:hypothetical protein [Arsenicicoccus sp. oral taxon 190]|uniref:hypothetical protein n=1 Tax=Arsenicicoccus sp. oral taxon 190 TaxID=1658671 RepID=UPI00067B4418|nr:hypothetical protein [Arsenicicoccus sp. oral taxon 190]
MTRVPEADHAGADRAALQQDARARRGQLTVASVALVLCWATVAVVTVLWWSRLPGDLAHQFATDGAAQAVRPRAAAVVSSLLGLVVPPAAFLAVIASRWAPRTASRLYVGSLVGLTAGLTCGYVILLHAHLDLTDAWQARLPAAALEPSVLAGVALGAVAAWVAPARPRLDRPTGPLRRLPLAPGAVAVWTARGVAPGWARGVLAAAVVVSTVTLLLQSRWTMLWLPLLIAVLAVACTSVRVTVDARGLTWRTPLGLPRGRVPLEDVTGAEVVQVNPAEYGGWGGFRIAPGHGFGVVMRGGSALRVTRRSGRRLTVTVDDADTGAALLDQLAHRV